MPEDSLKPVINTDERRQVMHRLGTRCFHVGSSVMDESERKGLRGERWKVRELAIECLGNSMASVAPLKRQATNGPPFEGPVRGKIVKSEREERISGP
jgi:hypothetical protein